MIFDYAPSLAGDLVLLRPLAAGDWPGLFAVASDPLIWAGHPAHDRWQESVFRAFMDEALTARGGLVVIDRASGAIIGSSRYSPERALPGEMEIGWTFLARSHWGGRYNRELKRLMLDHLFGQGVARAIFLVGESNIRSRTALERIGARLTDRTHQSRQGGLPVRHLIYSMGREAWLAA